MLGRVLKVYASHHFCSVKYTIVDEMIKIVIITEIHEIYSILCLYTDLSKFLIIFILFISSKILNTLKILNTTNIEYVQTQYSVTKIKNGKNDSKSNMFNNFNGNLFL